jgi:hypothetical protein
MKKKPIFSNYFKWKKNFNFYLLKSHEGEKIILIGVKLNSPGSILIKILKF